MIVRQCDTNYPTCWLVGQFTVPADGTWWFRLLNRAGGPTLLDVFQDGSWLGGRAALVTKDTLPYSSTPVELTGTAVKLEPVAVPAPQALEFNGDSAAQSPTVPVSGGDTASATQDNVDNADSSASPGALPWLLGILVGLGLVTVVLIIVRRHHRAAT